MYRNSSSPIFDAPEFPTLRRVKPLPKRRRTSSNTAVIGPGTLSYTSVANGTTIINHNIDGVPGMVLAGGNGVPHTLHVAGLPPIPLTLPGPDATAEELLAHADALQSYYLPILGAAASVGGVGAAAEGYEGSVGGNGLNINVNFNSGDSTSPPSLVNGAATPAHDPSSVGPLSDLDQRNISSFGSGLGGLGGLGNAGLNMSNLSLRDREDDSDHGDGDYIDHLQQPGNTKKRKVPANHSGSLGNDRDPSSGQLGEDDIEALERERTMTVGIPTGHALESSGDREGGTGNKLETDPTASLPSRSLRLLTHRKGRMSAVTLAGLQHKETLKNRKRQLAAVLGALSHGDTLALDQALSGAYPFVSSDSVGGTAPDELASFGIEGSGVPKVRLSKRKGPRMARKSRTLSVSLKENVRKVHVPESDFTFVCHSATADRLIATKEEVAMLRNRFEAELARQAAKTAKLAAASKAMTSSSSKGSRQKRGDRAQQRAHTGNTSEKKSGDQPAEFLDRSGSQAPSTITSTTVDSTLPSPSTKLRNGKKKKRSALANASNPHHLRNYIPSRLPHSGGGGPPNSNQANSNDLGPLPLRFLSAEIPPRRRKRSSQSQVQPQSQLSSLSLTNPADEWVCAFCEYQLFFGDELEYRRAVRKRKQILKRRRRARERAAAAASGTGVTARKQEKESHDGDYDEDADYEPVGGQASGNGVSPKPAKWRGDNRERGAGGEQSAYG